MTRTTSYLETYIVPVCRFETVSGTARIRDFFGTAFFVGAGGVFLTASHVISDATHATQENGGFMGLCVRPPGGEANVTCPIKSIEAAAAPYDVSVGTIEATFPTDLVLGGIPASVWLEVASYGYPSTAQNRSNDEFWMYGRGFRGYIHREVRSGQLYRKPSPGCV